MFNPDLMQPPPRPSPVFHASTKPLQTLGDIEFRIGARRGSRTLTPFRAADFESAASAISPPWLFVARMRRIILFHQRS